MAHPPLASGGGGLDGVNGTLVNRVVPGGRKIEFIPGLINGNNPQIAAARAKLRTYDYSGMLPYVVESDEERLQNLASILEYLYVAIQAGDFIPDAVHWTRELKSWLNLKFALPKPLRARLVHIYYELALAPGIDSTASDRFASMFMTLLKRKSYLKPGEDLTLDWRPLASALKAYCLPKEAGLVHSTIVRRNVRTLMKMCAFAQNYFDPCAIPDMLEKYLPHFSASVTEGAFVVIGLFNLLLPTAPPPEGRTDLYPQHYLPTLFHLTSLIGRSKRLDINSIDIFSRLARDCLHAEYIPFSEYGIFTKEQSSQIFTTILRMLEIPVGQATSAYSESVDSGAGLALVLERDHKKNPSTHHIARWIIMSLSPACLEKEDSVLSNLEGLIQAIETFFHPSNSGHWTKNLSQLVYYMTDFFVMRWNKEHSGEMDVPLERRLNETLRKRFVLSLRDVIFMGIYAKSGTAMTFSLSTLQNLAYLEPSLILPGALQRIYPSMQGLVEVHRTTSSLRALQILSRTMVRSKGFRCHVTALLALALPGIDANDLDKTLHTLSYIQVTCYNIPFHDLTKGHDEISGSTAAIEWVSSQVARLEAEGAGVEIDYETELSDEDEAVVLRSSTTGFAEFLNAFIEKVFTLLENLPDAARVRGGSAEEMVQNTLPATFTPLFACLSEDLYDKALDKIANFISSRVIHQARDAMAFICNSLCKVNPKKALARLVPILIQGIRTEIDENHAASTRNTGSDVLPRDRALVWNVSMLSMCCVHVGAAVLDHKDELFDIAGFMQERCKGTPTVHVSNFVHHLLLNLTAIYPVDYALYESEVLAKGLDTEDWGRLPGARGVNAKWHCPSKDEIDFAIKLFSAQITTALDNLNGYISDRSALQADSYKKEWSDEVSRNLVLLRLLISGMSYVFDSAQIATVPEDITHGESVEALEAGRISLEDQPINKGLSRTYNGIESPTHTKSDQSSTGSAESAQAALGGTEETEPKPTFDYPVGFILQINGPQYNQIHSLREQAGRCLHDVHGHLVTRHEDDVACFTALYGAYRAWFIDVGIERSAHTLDRVTRLLSADIHPYKVSGLRKEYPRPLLIRRAQVYHLQRLRHNAAPRIMTWLDKRLLNDLVESCVSSYTEIRKNAQYAGEAAMKVLVGAKTFVIPTLLDNLETSIKENSFPKIKGSMYSLLLGSVGKTVERDWRYAPRVIKAYVDLVDVDKPSIQKIAASATYVIMDYGRPAERLVILNDNIIKKLIADVQKISKSGAIDLAIEVRKERILKKRETIEKVKGELAVELVSIAKKSHWRKASRTAALVVALGLRFHHIAADSMIDLVTSGTVDTHPSLRGLYSGALVALFSLIEMRAACQHDYAKYLLNKQKIANRVKMPTRRTEPEWTAVFLKNFARPNTHYYIDHDHPGWLVWKGKMPAYEASPTKGSEYDGVELRVRSRIGALLTREWFATFFDYLKQEPRDSAADRFRMSSAMLLLYVFELVLDGTAKATFEDVKEEITRIYDDGSDKHQHRATSEILGALLTTVTHDDVKTRTMVWDYAFPIVKQIFEDGLTPENSSYWTTFLHLVLQGKDPRRSWPMVEYLSSFRLDMTSNAAFKESSKIQMLQQCIVDSGWHFQLQGPILNDFLAHINHPYKGVREAMGQTIAAMYRYQYHESYQDVKTLIKAQSDESSLGVQPYRPSAQFSNAVRDVFHRLETWRGQRIPGQQAPSPYTMGCKTVLLWLESTLSSHECASLVSFFPDTFLQQLLHMMDIKEDPELMSLAYHVFRHLPNVPHTVNETDHFIASLIQIGKTSPSWHQRLRILIDVQTLYFRRLFLTTESQRKDLFDCVVDILKDSQVEVRTGAAATLSGMIKCSPAEMRETIVKEFMKQFTTTLSKNPRPRRTGNSTPTPEQTQIMVKRHSSVLGLGALVNAFPYMSPPPKWLPGILDTLANKASSEPGLVGKSAKQIISDFKKTRQDTWHVDKTVFTSEQLEDLDGVLWKPYFA